MSSILQDMGGQMMPGPGTPPPPPPPDPTQQGPGPGPLPPGMTGADQPGGGMLDTGQSQDPGQLEQAMSALQQMGAQSPPVGKPLGRPAIAGINAELADRFKALQGAVHGMGGNLYIFSGSRDHAKQAQMFAAAVKRYGSEKEAKKHVSLPGKSSHHPNAGLAKGMGDGAVGVDVRGDLHLAHRLAPQFGLVFPDKNVPWHMEIAGAGQQK